MTILYYILKYCWFKPASNSATKWHEHRLTALMKPLKDVTEFTLTAAVLKSRFTAQIYPEIMAEAGSRGMGTLTFSVHLQGPLINSGKQY